MYLYMLYIQFAIKKTNKKTKTKTNPLYLRNLDRVYYNTRLCQFTRRLLSQPTIGAERESESTPRCLIFSFLEVGFLYKHASSS